MSMRYRLKELQEQKSKLHKRRFESRCMYKGSLLGLGSVPAIFVPLF